MKNLLYKEFVLSSHPTMFIFPVFGRDAANPILSVLCGIHLHLSRDLFYLSGRPRKQRRLLHRQSAGSQTGCRQSTHLDDCNRRSLSGYHFCAVRNSRYSHQTLRSKNGNEVGIEANVAFFGLVLVMYALFNIIFIPMVYKTAYKLGIPLMFGGIAITIYILAVEAVFAI